MLKIAWICYGFVDRDHIAADGTANIRIPIIERLLDRGDKVYFLGPRRKQSHDKIIFVESVIDIALKYKEFVKTYKGKTKVKDFIIQYDFKDNPLPDLDIVIFELNGMGLNMPFNAAILRHYHERGARIIIFDTDAILGGMRAYANALDIDINQFDIITPYIKPNNGPNIVIYFPYNKAEERMIHKGERLVYIGNDYGRREKLRRFYNFEFADIYGKYKDEAWKSKMKCNFKGQITPGEVHDIYNEALMCVHVAHKSYEKIKAMGQRINEVLESGTLLFADGFIKGIKEFLDKEYLVLTGEDVIMAYAWVKNMDLNEYIIRVWKQRQKIKEICTYGKFMEVIS